MMQRSILSVILRETQSCSLCCTNIARYTVAGLGSSSTSTTFSSALYGTFQGRTHGATVLRATFQGLTHGITVLRATLQGQIHSTTVFRASAFKGRT